MASELAGRTARYAGGVGVAFLELIRRAVHDHVAHLVQRAGGLHVAGQRGAVVGVEELGDPGADGARARRCWPSSRRRTCDVLVERSPGRPLEHLADVDQLHVPFEVLGAGLAGVLHLVAEVQGELDVVAAPLERDVGRQVEWRVERWVVRAGQDVQDTPADRGLRGGRNRATLMLRLVVLRRCRRQWAMGSTAGGARGPGHRALRRRR